MPNKYSPRIDTLFSAIPFSVIIFYLHLRFARDLLKFAATIRAFQNFNLSRRARRQLREILRNNRRRMHDILAFLNGKFNDCQFYLTVRIQRTYSHKSIIYTDLFGTTFTGQCELSDYSFLPSHTCTLLNFLFLPPICLPSHIYNVIYSEL